MLHPFTLNYTQVSQKLMIVDIDKESEGERSPSPEPIYDENGTRINTRIARRRNKLLEERKSLIEQAAKLNPMLAGEHQSQSSLLILAVRKSSNDMYCRRTDIFEENEQNLHPIQRIPGQ